MLPQIRTGTQLAPSLRHPHPIIGTEQSCIQEFNDVFAHARGPKGQELRKNAERVAEELRTARLQGGRDEIRRLIAF